VTISVSGKRVDAVVQLTKQGFAFVFDRVTGKPIWPIEERPVPASDVAGEQAWLTQPFPIRPPVFTEQGVTLEDAFDLTPALKAAAEEEMKKFRIGPLYTPPTLQGTVMRPGVIGGANWGGGAFDPETGILYVKTSNLAHMARIRAPDRSPANPRASEVDADLVGDLSASAEFVPPAPEGSGTEGAKRPPLPLLKPPYGHLVAIDLGKGTISWRVPFGDNPALRQHPALRDVKLPERLGAAGAPGVLVTKGGLVFAGGGDTALWAIDKTSGREIWHAPLPRRTTATPMTYRARSGRQFIVIATGAGADAALMAFAIGGAARTSQ
jgi:quinoprotein glucose dehydrogenase